MHRTPITEVRQEDAETVTLLLEKPAGFAYLPGQFIVVGGVLDGKPMRRSYSLASAPHEQTINVTVRRQDPGRFSPVLCGMQEGEELDVLGPYGQFLLPDDTDPLTFIAAGTGIVPFMSFLRDMKQQKDARKTTLLYSNRLPETTLYDEEISSYEDDNFTAIRTMTRPEGIGWEGLTGRITKEMIAEHCDLTSWFFVCGPTSMVKAVREMLHALGVQKHRVKVEMFGNIQA